MPSEHRLHPLSVVFTLGSNLRNLLIPGLVVLFAARSTSWDVWLMVLLVPYTVVAVVRYLSYRYQFAHDELVIRTGLIFRNERHIPYTRIHNIGSVQNPFHRMAGVAEVRVETAGGQEPEARLQVLSLEALDEMRRRVAQGKSDAGAPAPVAAGERPREAASPAPQTASRPLLHLPVREVIIYGIVNNRGMVVLAAVWGIAWEMGLFGGWQFDPASWDRFTIGRSEVAAVLGHLGLAIGGFFLLLAALRLLSVGWALVKLYGFTLEISGPELRTSCGLFTRITTIIPLRRIQLLSIRETPLQRLFGRAALRADTAGGPVEEEQGGVGRRWLAPIVRRDELPRLLAEIQPEIDLARVEWKPVDQRAWRRILKTSLIISGLLTIGVVWLARWWGLLAFVPLALLSVVNARRQVRNMGWALTEEMVLFRSGWLWRDVSLARLGKIQTVALAHSPFDRRWRMARLLVDTAGGGQGSQRIHIPFLGRDLAGRLYEMLSASAARTAFRW